jgi:hypothetical protein
MKIYIQESESIHLNLAKKLNQKILDTLDKHLVKKYNVIDIYSKEGIYQIYENQTSKLYVKSEKRHKNIEMKIKDGKNITLVIDDSIVDKETVFQIPCDHVNIPLTIKTYALNKSSKFNKFGLFLVIEFIEKEEGVLTPINYYFEYNSEIDENKNILIEDINVFLSLLN